MLTYGYGLLIFGLLNVVTRSEPITQKDLKHVTNYSRFQPELQSFDDPPPCSNGLPFCENVESYPYAHIKNILDKNPIYKRLFSNAEKDEYTSRIIDRRHFACKSIPKTIYPKFGKNKNGEWKYIINQDHFTQSVRVEVCRRLGGHCDVIGEVPEDAKTICKQKYVYTSLLSISDDDSPTTDTFQIPSSCCCSYKRNMDFSANDV